MSKDEVIPKLAQVFRQYGYEGATLARLSEATGLGKASLYHYFPKGKEEMAAAVLNHVSPEFKECILAPLYGDGAPEERIRTMSKNVAEYYNHGQKTCLLAALALGDAKDLFHAQLQRALNVWVDALAQVLIEAGLDAQRSRYRAEDAILQIQGAIVLARVLDDTTPFKRVIDRLPKELLGEV